MKSLEYWMLIMENIHEGNKLIAEFMGYKYLPADKFVSWGRFGIGDEGEQMSDPIYHSSWDWLMPVVEKLRKLLVRFVFVQNSHSSIIRGSNGTNSFDFIEEGTDVLTAFNLMQKSILWYNLNNLKQSA